MSRRRAAGGERRLYVFALSRANARVPAAIGRHRLERIAIGGIAAIAERRASMPIPSERSLRDQHRVVVALHRHAGALIPVRFGALLERAELERIVRLRRTTLARALARVRGRSQMTIRAVGARAAQGQAASAMTMTSGTAYLASRARAARPAVPAAAEAVRQAVRALVAAESIEAGRGGVGVTINHLIRTRDADAYIVRARRAVTGDQAGTLTLSGPWPPFAFAPEIMDATA